ncbi:MAG: type IV pili twitching motility protein PilT [Micavibrio aeruginosavorus]|uniref:Type IV pili twitching motility protein PilT n=1 Tax=Micavibrio aeruginosavorus TaxID=349221 RepID=A0A2W5H8E8_9BACT|nr:MAG: type IV pili twitching motility protein PilT [Micavibrio aeruginosavorus]
MNEKRATDLYLTVGHPPVLRIEDRMENLGDHALQVADLDEILNNILTLRQKREFETNMELNSALDMGAYGRFRVNVLKQRQSPALVIRRIVSKIPDFEELNLPPLFEQMALQKRGLILVTGMTGSGKSTTLASMIDYRNRNSQGHIITIEDPIEYHHEHQQSIISQREVGVDTENYAIALKNALRQRPDVILVGEIRDREVMEQALTASETGHLCLATIHTNNSYQAIQRVVNLFPEEQKHQICFSIASNLKAIISQRLIPTTRQGQTIALEILLNEGHVRELIQEGKFSKIKDVIESNQASGMCSFDQSLLALYTRGLISEQTALAQSDLPGDLQIKIKQVKMGEKIDVLSRLDTASMKISE